MMFLTPEKESSIRGWVKDVSEKMGTHKHKHERTQTSTSSSASASASISIPNRTSDHPHIIAPTPVRLTGLGSAHHAFSPSNPILALALAPIREAHFAPLRPHAHTHIPNAFKSSFARARDDDGDSERQWQDAEREVDPVVQRLAERAEALEREIQSMEDGSPRMSGDELERDEEEDASPPVPPNTTADVDEEKGEDEETLMMNDDDDDEKELELERAPRKAMELQREYKYPTTYSKEKDEKYERPGPAYEHKYSCDDMEEGLWEFDTPKGKITIPSLLGTDPDSASDEKLVASIQYYDRVKQKLMDWNTYKSLTTGEMRQARISTQPMLG